MIPIVSRRFGQWLVIARVPPVQGRRGYVHVRCACGTAAVVESATLRAGTSQSCGHGRPRGRHQKWNAV